MNPIALSFIRMFASPVGAMINKLLASAGAAVVGYSTSKGNPLGDVSGVVGAMVVAVSTVISGYAASQGVQIPVINDDMNNGVRVVPVQDARAAGISPVDHPLPH